MSEMRGRDIALTGIPRGGTTLACRLLGLCEGAVALFEPMDVRALPCDDRSAAIDAVEAFFVDARAQLLRDGSAPSKQRDGAVPDNPFAARDASGERRQQVTLGRLRLPTPPAPDFTLVVKHNAAFAALLPELGVRFETLAIVRNPLAVLASWNSVTLPVSEGRLPAGERLDPGLSGRLTRIGDRIARQLEVLDWFFARYTQGLVPDRVLRYEALIASQGVALHALAGVSGAADPSLAERNASAQYPRDTAAQLFDALRSRDGAWQAWYPPTEIEALAARMLAE